MLLLLMSKVVNALLPECILGKHQQG
jgi:hypothetical protein